MFLVDKTFPKVESSRCILLSSEDNDGFVLIRNENLNDSDSEVTKVCRNRTAIKKRT
jgi:hypothetical protein